MAAQPNTNDMMTTFKALGGKSYPDVTIDTSGTGTITWGGPINTPEALTAHLVPPTFQERHATVDVMLLSKDNPSYNNVALRAWWSERDRAYRVDVDKINDMLKPTPKDIVTRAMKAADDIISLFTNGHLIESAECTKAGTAVILNDSAKRTLALSIIARMGDLK